MTFGSFQGRTLGSWHTSRSQGSLAFGYDLRVIPGQNPGILTYCIGDLAELVLPAKGLGFGAIAQAAGGGDLDVHRGARSLVLSLDG